MRAIRKEQLQPRPTVRNLPDALARWFQAMPFRVVDDAPPLRDLVVIKVGDPNAALGEEPLDQLMSLHPPGPRDGPLAVRRPRAGGHCRLTAASDRRVVVDQAGNALALTDVDEPATRSSSIARPLHFLAAAMTPVWSASFEVFCCRKPRE
jgi:hypothetical protein